VQPPSRPPSLVLAAASAFVLLSFAPESVHAQCTYNALGNDVPVSTASATTFYTFSGLSGSWGAVAVRPDAGTNHDLAVFSTTAGSPTCVSGQVGASAGASGVDLVVGDFRAGRNGLGPWYSKVSRVSGAGNAVVEWDRGGEELVVDDDPIVRNTDQVVDVFNVFLEGGVGYIVAFQPSMGVDAKVLIFRNPAAAPYWAGRSARLIESSGPTNFTAPTSDLYCVVVVNDDGGFSTYSLAIDQCQPPILLTSTFPVSTSPPLRYGMDQVEAYWSAIGVRGTGTEDWDVIGYKTGRGALEPVCFKDSVAASKTVGPGVDFVVGDFTFNPLAPYFARVLRVTGSQAGVVEWDDGPDEFSINAPPAERATGPGDVLEIWDAFLQAGTAYTIFFERTGAADTRYLVFENALQSAVTPYWAGRANAVQTGTTYGTYTPLVTGYHGIAVVNDNGGVGNYRIGVNGSAVDVGPGGPARARLDALAPNPAFGRTTIAYTLPRAGTVGFDVLDVTGRLVTRVPAREAPAGPGRESWDARSAGGRVPPGVYFVSMNFAGKRVGLQKLVLLP
jgi:hypothetical protein